MRKTILTETVQKIKTGNGVLDVCGKGRLGVCSSARPLNSADACILRSFVSAGKLAHICPVLFYLRKWVNVCRGNGQRFGVVLYGCVWEHSWHP